MIHHQQILRFVLGYFLATSCSTTLSFASFIPTNCQITESCHSLSIGSGQSRRSSVFLRSSGSGFDGLSSALSKLESQWIENSKVSSQKSNKNRWEKIILDNFGDGDEEKRNVGSTYSQLEEQVVYLLTPPNNSTPSSIVLFLGGAVLGSYPHIAYSELLHRLSDKTNAAVLSVPYAVGINHFDISKLCEKIFQKSIRYMDEKVYPQSSSNHNNNFAGIDSLPVYALGHSLGCKLHLIRMAAVTNSWKNLKGIAFISFNNYGLPQSVSMAKSFATKLNGAAQQESSNDAIMDFFFDFVEQTTQGIGLDFSPNPTETERIINMKFTADLQEKCRMFKFDNDELDCTAQFISSCPTSSIGTPSLSVLPGTHLTPVYLKFGVNDLPETAQMFTGKLTDFRSASFGDDEQLDILVEELCGWMNGKPPRHSSVRQTTPQLLSTGINDKPT